MAIHHDKMAYGKLASTREELSEARINEMLSFLADDCSFQLADLHVHTKFSYDSQELPQRYIERALELGCSYVGFSEHYDLDNAANGEPTAVCDVVEYGRETDRLRSEYGGRITVLKGVELGFDERVQAEYKRMLSDHSFDYVINSVHSLPGLGDCYYPRFFASKSKEQAYGDYLNALLKSVNADYEYHIIGHIGYVSRYAKFEKSALVYKDFAKILDEILRAIIARGVSLEINTSVGSSGSRFLPDESILLRYLELGGDKFTYGSDAHSAEKYSLREEKAAAFLRENGISRTCVYVGGKCKYLDL